MSYYVADGDQRRGPFTLDQLKAQGLHPDTLVWKEGMPEWVRAESVPELREAFQSVSAPPPPPPPMGGYRPGPMPMGPMGAPPYNQSEVSGKKIAAGVLGIVVGSLGIHKFVLGMTGPGLVMLLVTLLTCGIGGIVMWVIGLVEGIIYLTKSDEEFYDRYMVHKQGWF